MTSVWIAETPDIRGPRRPLVANLDLISFKSFEKGCGSREIFSRLSLVRKRAHQLQYELDRLTGKDELCNSARGPLGVSVIGEHGPISQ